MLTVPRLVRDQANKTVEQYLQRVRKYGDTLGETAQPVQNTPETARVTAPNGSSSWAGWAISSFTNKATSAQGEIQTTGTAATASENYNIAKRDSGPGARPASVSRTSSPFTNPEVATNTIPQVQTPPLFRAASEQPSENTTADDDVFDAWGAMDDEDDENEKEDDTFFDAKPSSSPAPKAEPVAFDDGGEPDFAGWLAAQSKAKSKKPLPKGLAKSNSTKDTVKRSASTSKSVAGSTSSLAKKSQPAKKIDTKPKEDLLDDDGWGDAWD